MGLSDLTGYFSSHKKTRSGPVPDGPSFKKTRSGQMSGTPPRSTGTGDRDRTRSVLWTSPSVTMGVSDGEEDWNSESGKDDGEGQRRDDEVEEVIQATSAVGGSAKSILLLPERNEDNTGWLSPEGMKSAADFNKMKPEDIATVCKHKEMFAAEVVKNCSVVDQ